jgi:hypothetical protein
VGSQRTHPPQQLFNSISSYILFCGPAVPATSASSARMAFPASCQSGWRVSSATHQHAAPPLRRRGVLHTSAQARAVKPQLQDGTSSSALPGEQHRQSEVDPALANLAPNPSSSTNGSLTAPGSNGNSQPVPAVAAPLQDVSTQQQQQQHDEQLSIQQPSSSNGVPPVAPKQKADTGWYYAVGLSAMAALICSVDRAAISVAILPMSEQYGWSDSTKGAINRCVS